MHPLTIVHNLQIDYYLSSHMKTVAKHWGPYGLKSWTVIQFRENDPSGQHVQAVMLWESIQAFEKAFEARIPEIVNDRPNYTDNTPKVWYSEVLGQGDV